MAAATSINVSGTWKELGADGVWVNVSGVWKPVSSIQSRVSGTWKDVYIRDNVGPAAPTSVVATWTATGAHVTWVDPPDADYSYMAVAVVPYGEPPYGPSAILPGVEAYTYLDTTNFGGAFTFWLTPYDTYGNAGPTAITQTMAWTGESRARIPSPREYIPSASGTWRGSAWRTDVTNRAFQGSTTNGENIGAYFYGDTIYNELRGTTVSEMSFEYVRYNSSGQGGAVEPEAWWSTISSKASSPVGTGSDKFTGTAVCRNGSCYSFAISNPPSSWYPYFVTPGYTRAKSILLDSDDTTLQSFLGDVSLSYMQLYGYDERPLGTTIIPGRVKFTHSG